MIAAVTNRGSMALVAFSGKFSDPVFIEQLLAQRARSVVGGVPRA